MPLSKVNKKWFKFGDWPLFNFYLSNALKKNVYGRTGGKGAGSGIESGIILGGGTS